MRPRGPPCVDLTAEFPSRLAALQVRIVGEGEYLSAPALLRHDMRQILSHHRIAISEQLDKPAVAGPRHCGMIIEKLPRDASVMSCLAVSALVGLGDQLRPADL